MHIRDLANMSVEASGFNEPLQLLTLTAPNSPMAAMSHMLRKFAVTDAPVLITGESGTGKEVSARAIHAASRRRDKPLTALNCAALPSELIASELFGYEKGAFTGAVTRKIGQIEHANGGTLFLDEIGDMPIDLQTHLLRFLQEGCITRVGGRGEVIRVDVRIIAATNVDLTSAMREGRFREDLFFRLNVLSLHMPPLRERVGDLEQLAYRFLAESAEQIGCRVHSLTTLTRAPPPSWPELSEPARVVAPMRTGPIGREALLAALARNQENISATAQELRVSRVTLYRMLRRFEVVLQRPAMDFPRREAA